jgi:2-polyprenyl-3-methyl-5-hydroxy-6-metoxy-1,4-benzoquinol methylase
MQDAARIRAEFDTLAQFSDDGWSHNSHYHPFLLKQLPPRIGSALDIGCGTGHFSRLLAAHADHVTGIDLSPEMIRIAQERSAHLPNIDYQVQDVTTWDAPPDTFDCIASIATLHHMPPETVYPKIAQMLKPGGVLLVLDLYQQSGMVELLSNIITIPLSMYHKRKNNVSSKNADPAESAAWQAHGAHDVYPTTAQIRETCARYLPGARFTRHLLWRYSIVWRKPQRVQ